MVCFKHSLILIVFGEKNKICYQKSKIKKRRNKINKQCEELKFLFIFCRHTLQVNYSKCNHKPVSGITLISWLGRAEDELRQNKREKTKQVVYPLLIQISLSLAKQLLFQETLTKLNRHLE